MHKKYLNLSDNFWLSEYLKFLVKNSEILIFDPKNLQKIEVESYILMYDNYQYCYTNNNIDSHLTLIKQFYQDIVRTTEKCQDILIDFIYTDLNLPKKSQNITKLAVAGSKVFLGGKSERIELEKKLKEYYVDNLDQEIIRYNDSKEQFFLNPYKLIKFNNDLANLPIPYKFFTEKSKSLGINIDSSLPKFTNNYNLIKNFESFFCWQIELGMFFAIKGSIVNTDSGLMQIITFNRLMVF